MHGRGHEEVICQVLDDRMGSGEGDAHVPCYRTSHLASELFLASSAATCACHMTDSEEVRSDSRDFTLSG